ncbi:hypothetical protein KUH03_04345 [Sphingobacterium sp. E70]|uniref:hypothetical protein n=1 Tax=Sphingobacterium sp. E70 TaxID=2853439 RepID=UPI00211BD203|nr:hypothetical protein [Sphingobacterium sp. E70]ULT26171.1 hypothetical protein KUH03_04345 [Sphingobacterium sp. E70]
MIDDLNPTTIEQLNDSNLLKECFVDGAFVSTASFKEIRNRLQTESIRVYGK